MGEKTTAEFDNLLLTGIKQVCAYHDYFVPQK